MTDLLDLIRSFNRKERLIPMTQVAMGDKALTVSDHFGNG